MQAESPVRRDAAPALVGSDELAEGLMLVRASTLKVIRLQLAMERHDRRVALEAVDELVALDRRIEHYLADVPQAQLMFRHELEVERAALNHEKLALVAGVIRAEPRPVEEVAEAQPEETWDEIEEGRPKRATWWLVGIFLLFSLAAAAAYRFMGGWS